MKSRIRMPEAMVAVTLLSVPAVTGCGPGAQPQPQSVATQPAQDQPRLGLPPGSSGRWGPLLSKQPTTKPEFERLRDRASEAYADDKRMKALLAGKWGESFAKEAGKEVLNGQGLFLESKDCLLDILAYLSRGEADSPIVKAAVEQFDAVLQQGLRDMGKGSPWYFAMNSAEEHGCTKLLTETFWRGYEAGRPATRVLEKLGDAEVLKRLEDVSRRQVFSKDSADDQLLHRTMSVIRAKMPK